VTKLAGLILLVFLALVMLQHNVAEWRRERYFITYRSEFFLFYSWFDG